MARGSKPLKLHLGCGESYLEGYVNIDLPPSKHNIMHVKADIYKDVRKLDYPENSVDEVRSHHMFEHFSRQEALKILFQWRRWLKPGGLLVIETPDFETAARRFVSGNIKTKFKVARHIFGSQESEWAFHRDWWGKEKFKFVLPESGFDDIKIKTVTGYATKKEHQLRRHHHYMLKLKIVPSFVDCLDNVIVTARKTTQKINEREIACHVLSHSLIGTEEKNLNIWLKEI